MTEWNKQHLEELVRKMGLRCVRGQEETPIHLSQYGPFPRSEPLLTKIMRLNVMKWSSLGYTETDRVSITRYLGSLGCRTDLALSTAAYFQQPLTLDLAKLLIDVGACDKNSLWTAAMRQQPLTLELAKLLISAGCDSAAQDWRGWDALVFLAIGGHPVDPQVTDLFLSAGCRTNLDGCKRISDERRLRFDQILKEHAEWKEQRDRLLAEHSSTDASYGPDWGR